MQKLENKDEIVKEYARYYKELLKVRPAENMEEEEIEQKVDKKFQEIIAGVEITLGHHNDRTCLPLDWS